MIVKEFCQYVRSYSELEGLCPTHRDGHRAGTGTGTERELHGQPGAVPGGEFSAGHAGDAVPV